MAHISHVWAVCPLAFVSRLQKSSGPHLLPFWDPSPLEMVQKVPCDGLSWIRKFSRLPCLPSCPVASLQTAFGGSPPKKLPDVPPGGSAAGVIFTLAVTCLHKDPWVEPCRHLSQALLPGPPAGLSPRAPFLAPIGRSDLIWILELPERPGSCKSPASRLYTGSSAQHPDTPLLPG